MSLRRRPIRSLVFAALLFLVSGGLLTASGSYTGNQATESVVRRSVQVGATSRDELVRRFGQPATQALRRGPGEVEIIGYSRETITRPAFPLLSLLALRQHEQVDTFFEITDGVVTRFWTEN